MSLTPFKENLTPAELGHLLRRTMFGIKVDVFRSFSNKTLSQVIDSLLTKTPAPDPPVNDYGKGRPNVEAEGIPYGETWIMSSTKFPQLKGPSFKAWWMGLIINQPATLEEKMVMFWHNHFATENARTYILFAYRTNALLRENTLGNFKVLARKITTDVGMLDYLNGNTNEKKSPDENYARELQELFTVGKGPNSNYTEDDVKAAARVLTGHRTSRNLVVHTFNPDLHDNKDKQFSSFYNNTIITGRTGADGEKEIDDLIDMLFAVDETALHLCRKLYRFFMYYTITDDIENNVIVPLANILIQNDFEIKPVLAALFKSEHFFNVDNRGSQIKSPVDHCAGIMRSFNIGLPPKNDYETYFIFNNFVREAAADMEQNIGDPPNVAGWPAYYQLPQYHEIWINSDTLIKRNEFSDLLITTGYNAKKFTLIINVIEFAKLLSTPSDPNIVVNESILFLLSNPVSDQIKSLLKSILLSGQQTDYYWTDAWNNYLSNPASDDYKSILETRLKPFYKYIMNLPEFQLC